MEDGGGEEGVGRRRRKRRERGGVGEDGSGWRKGKERKGGEREEGRGQEEGGGGWEGGEGGAGIWKLMLYCQYLLDGRLRRRYHLVKCTRHSGQGESLGECRHTLSVGAARRVYKLN